MQFLSQIGMFALQAIVIVAALLVLISGVVSIGRKPKPQLEITSLNNEASQVTMQMQKAVLGKATKIKKNKKTRPKAFVIDFVGDIKAGQVEQLRQEVSAILSIATQDDQVIARIESPGGAVNAYGLAASQLQRIRDKQLPLTVCIDKMAASGGYLMACVANQIIAAPFAIIGSIGVVAQLPNFHRWLQKNSIDVELLTAGEYKRTLTLFGENTDKGRKKFQEDLEQIHLNFRNYVFMNRAQLDLDAVATGEHWLATDAADLHLVDAIQTSDEYIHNQMETYDLYHVKLHAKKSLADKILTPAYQLLTNIWR